MTPEHIMQTRSTQSILKRVFGFNYSETGKLLNKPRMLRIITTLVMIVMIVITSLGMLIAI
jgi:hypothetical protein